MHCQIRKINAVLIHFQIRALARSGRKLNSSMVIQSIGIISCWVPLNLFRARPDRIQFMRFNSCARFGCVDLSFPLSSVNALVSPENCPLARALGEIQSAIHVSALGDGKAIVG